MKIKMGSNRGKKLHSVEASVELLIEETARKEIEKIVLETIYIERPEFREVVDKIVGEITHKASQEARNKWEAMDILYKELIRLKPEVIDRTKEVIFYG